MKNGRVDHGSDERTAAQVEYATPRRPPCSHHSPATAVLLCSPALILFTTLALGLARRWVPRSLPDVTLPPHFVLLTFIFAMATGLVSVPLYLPGRTKPWYVWLNLSINISCFVLAILFFVLLVFVVTD